MKVVRVLCMRGWRRWACGAGLLLGFCGLLISTSFGRQCLHRIDREWFGERIIDTFEGLLLREDWREAVALRSGQNYHWLKSGGAPLRIAHALGGAGTPRANTLGSMRSSYLAGFRVFEVDLVLEQGELRCQHDPGPQVGMVRDGCTFDTLIAALPPDAFVVLDVKTEFATVGQRIVDQIKSTPDVGRVVFQLYRPEDFAVFNEWQRETDLPGPILTAYRSHWSVNHLASQVERLGVRAFTLPLERLSALSIRPGGAALLVHPIHDCEAWSYALQWVEGIYTLATLHCAPTSTNGTL